MFNRFNNYNNMYNNDLKAANVNKKMTVYYADGSVREETQEEIQKRIASGEFIKNNNENSNKKDDELNNTDSNIDENNYSDGSYNNNIPALEAKPETDMEYENTETESPEFNVDEELKEAIKQLIQDEHNAFVYYKNISYVLHNGYNRASASDLSHICYESEKFLINFAKQKLNIEFEPIEKNIIKESSITLALRRAIEAEKKITLTEKSIYYMLPDSMRCEYAKILWDRCYRVLCLMGVRL